MIDHVRLNRYNFLIAESNSWDRRQLASMLRAAGAMNIQHAGDGSEALEAVAQQVPDIAIIGEKLAFLSGRELVSAIRDHESKPINHMPILFIVSKISRKGMTELARLGVHEVLCKPFSTKTLIDRIYWTLMVPRPFIRIRGYFGPEPRGKFWKHVVGISTRGDTSPDFLEDRAVGGPVPVHETDVIEL
ncbi:MAG: response regulator [Tepidamorphaceae bacterium]|nr:response regulator [Rhodobiaceae bacterium]MCC0047794.1 response regulator [Rhodobiaceae bacterium]